MNRNLIIALGEFGKSILEALEVEICQFPDQTEALARTCLFCFSADTESTALNSFLKEFFGPEKTASFLRETQNQGIPAEVDKITVHLIGDCASEQGNGFLQIVPEIVDLLEENTNPNSKLFVHLFLGEGNVTSGFWEGIQKEITDSRKRIPACLITNRSYVAGILDDEQLKWAIASFILANALTRDDNVLSFLEQQANFLSDYQPFAVYGITRFSFPERLIIADTVKAAKEELFSWVFSITDKTEELPSLISDFTFDLGDFARVESIDRQVNIKAKGIQEKILRDKPILFGGPRSVWIPLLYEKILNWTAFVFQGKLPVAESELRKALLEDADNSESRSLFKDFAEKVQQCMVNTTAKFRGLFALPNILKKILEELSDGLFRIPKPETNFSTDFKAIEEELKTAIEKRIEPFPYITKFCLIGALLSGILVILNLTPGPLHLLRLNLLTQILFLILIWAGCLGFALLRIWLSDKRIMRAAETWMNLVEEVVSSRLKKISQDALITLVNKISQFLEGKLKETEDCIEKIKKTAVVYLNEPEPVSGSLTSALFQFPVDKEKIVELFQDIIKKIIEQCKGSISSASFFQGYPFSDQALEEELKRFFHLIEEEVKNKLRISLKDIFKVHEPNIVWDFLYTRNFELARIKETISPNALKAEFLISGDQDFPEIIGDSINNLRRLSYVDPYSIYFVKLKASLSLEDLLIPRGTSNGG